MPILFMLVMLIVAAMSATYAIREMRRNVARYDESQR